MKAAVRFLFFSSLLLYFCLGENITDTVFSKFTEDDVIFGDNLLRSTSAVSASHCGSQCTDRDSCKAFTFTEGTEIGHCRLHSALFTASTPVLMRAYGTRAYLVEKDVFSCRELVQDGWTVIQRRLDGSVNFNRSWTDYVNGFGTASGDFWLGLEALHRLTSVGNWQLRFDMEDAEGKTAYLAYRGFYIDNSTENYRMHFIAGSREGTTPGCFFQSWEQMFSTYDSDNDGDNTTNCAAHRRGGWWFQDCDRPAWLNGDYGTQYGMQWLCWDEAVYPFVCSAIRTRRVG